VFRASKIDGKQAPNATHTTRREIAMTVRTSILVLALCAPGLPLAAQNSIAANTAPSNQAPAASVALPSATLRPSLDVLRTALSSVHIDRWKASNAIRDEASSNIGSIQRDLQNTLPGLLAAADAAPSSAAKTLPAYRNIEALYDVMLRVDAAARLAAPSDQMSAIDQALARLDDGRRALGEQLQQDADAQETQVIHLQAALKAIPPPQPPPPPPAPVKCPVAPVVHRKKPATAAAKPATPPASQNSTPSH
jgi:hypothetical protein